jgi:chromosome segregation ATPase
MVTEPPRSTTLAQYKTALDLAEAAKLKLTQELDATRKTNAQLSADLQATKLSATSTQDQLTGQLKARQTELDKLRKDMTALEKQLASAQAQATKAQADIVKAQTEAAKAQADKAAAEALAKQQLTDASEVMNRQKLAAVAAADREVKLNAENAALHKQLEQATTVSLTVADTSGQLAQLRKQIDALVAENRRMAESCEQLSHDQQALAATIDGQKLAQTQAVDKARTEAQLVAQQQIDKLQESLRLGQSRLTTLTAQLQSSGKLEVLAPDQVGALMSSFLKQVEGGMPSLKLAEGELKLKLGLASAGQTQGFVILQPGAQADAQTAVHEVALKFDRSGALNLPVAKS